MVIFKNLFEKELLLGATVTINMIAAKKIASSVLPPGGNLWNCSFECQSSW